MELQLSGSFLKMAYRTVASIGNWIFERMSGPHSKGWMARPERAVASYWRVIRRCGLDDSKRRAAKLNRRIGGQRAVRWSVASPHQLAMVVLNHPCEQWRTPFFRPNVDHVEWSGETRFTMKFEYIKVILTHRIHIIDMKRVSEEIKRLGEETRRDSSMSRIWSRRELI